MFVHAVVVDKKGYKRLEELFAKFKQLGVTVTGHGFKRNNPDYYIIYATKDLSKVLRSSGFIFTARQI